MCSDSIPTQDSMTFWWNSTWRWDCSNPARLSGVDFDHVFVKTEKAGQYTWSFRWQVHLPLHHNQWLRMEASAMLLLEREHRVHDTDSLLHEFLLVFHKSSVIRVHQLIIYIKSQEVCLPLYRRMRQMDKDGKKMVAEFVYRHAVWQTFFWIDPFFRGFWISIPNGERGIVS